MTLSLVRRALGKIALPEEEKTDQWSNEDIRPVPPERQLWGESRACFHAGCETLMRLHCGLVVIVAAAAASCDQQLDMCAGPC